MGRGPRFLVDWKSEYRKKLHSVEDTAAVIQSNTRIFSHGWISDPHTLMQAIAARKDELTGIEWCSNNSFEPYMDLTGEHFSYNQWSVGAGGRRDLQRGIGTYTVMHFWQTARELREIEVDYALLTVSEPDENGFMSFGATVSLARALIDRAKTVIVQVNPNVPYVCGDAHVHVSEVDYICEAEDPLTELPYVEPSENAKTIAAYISEFIEDGSTIQLGIGKVPNAIASFLVDKHDLGVHSEMFTESMMDLVERGVITNSKKSMHKYRSVATFTGGSKKLYKWVENNPFVQFHPVEYVNNPNVIAQQHKLVSINTSLSIDLSGQCCSEAIGLRQHSGVGGQVDFNLGAGMNPESKAFIAINSVAETKNGRVSAIVPFHAGGFISTSRNDVEYIVTEYGVARMRGRSMRERAEQLIAIAHPDFREELRAEARRLLFI